MTRIKSVLAVASLLLAAAVLPVRAASSASSSASEGVSDSVGSSSTSIEKSSKGSSNSSNGDKVADGDYKVIDVATAADRPGMLRLKLQAVTDDSAEGELFLVLPQQAVAQNRVEAGQVVRALTRPYGIEFAKADTGKAFFLVLADSWHDELQTRAVSL